MTEREKVLGSLIPDYLEEKWGIQSEDDQLF